MAIEKYHDTIKVDTIQKNTGSEISQELTDFSEGLTVSGMDITDVNKIDSEEVDGLLGVDDSLAYKVHEIEGHLHSAGRFFGYSGTPNATALLTSITPWNLVSGTGDYGTAVQIFLGDEDFDLPFTPYKFDPHRLFAIDVSADAIYKIRIANSQWTGSAHTYATMASAVTANKYTESILQITSTKEPAASIPVQTGRAVYGSKVWAQVWSSTNGADIDILLGVHAYIG